MRFLTLLHGIGVIESSHVALFFVIILFIFFLDEPFEYLVSFFLSLVAVDHLYNLTGFFQARSFTRVVEFRFSEGVLRIPGVTSPVHCSFCTSPPLGFPSWLPRLLSVGFVLAPNHVELKAVFPKFQKQIKFPTRENNILDQVYCNISGAYRAVAAPHLGMSDHISVELLPAYVPVICRTRPTTKTVQVWSEVASSTLQDCFEHTNWEDKKDLTRVVKTAQGIVGGPLPNLDSLYTSRLQKKARCIATDPTHPGYGLFVPLPSRKRYRHLNTRTNRLKNSFFPRAVRELIPSP
ncbi:hypothetical protein N1851_033277 [Merluccius polli]|uniref:Uncharacterized protein n=1 Tax=Merluccius polli TaxID=89951 RepID=A0AA47M1K8_MERPO|nr:hypothetical protein N1851_033277 [Merluccius polli]